MENIEESMTKIEYKEGENTKKSQFEIEKETANYIDWLESLIENSEDSIKEIKKFALLGNNDILSQEDETALFVFESNRDFFKDSKIKIEKIGYVSEDISNQVEEYLGAYLSYLSSTE